MHATKVNISKLSYLEVFRGILTARNGLGSVGGPGIVLAAGAGGVAAVVWAVACSALTNRFISFRRYNSGRLKARTWVSGNLNGPAVQGFRGCRGLASEEEGDGSEDGVPEKHVDEDWKFVCL